MEKSNSVMKWNGNELEMGGKGVAGIAQDQDDSLGVQIAKRWNDIEKFRKILEKEGTFFEGTTIAEEFTQEILREIVSVLNDKQKEESYVTSQRV